MAHTRTILMLALLAVGAAASGCGTGSQFSPGKGGKYVYSYRMIAPVDNNDMLFQDDSLIIQFRIDEAAVKFQVQNLSRSNMVIDYDHAAVGVDGLMQPVRFSRTLYEDTMTVRESVLLPPMAFVRDIVIPWANVTHDGRRWIESDLLPTVDNDAEQQRRYILSRPGKSIVTLVLPVRFGGAAKPYTFDFQVTGVVKIPWRDYQPPKRVPPPPEPEPQFLDQVTTAIISVGVLGFTAFLIAASKEPATE